MSPTVSLSIQMTLSLRTLKQKSPRKIAADERWAKANVPEAAVMYGQSGNAVNRVEEVLIL